MFTRYRLGAIMLLCVSWMAMEESMAGNDPVPQGKEVTTPSGLKYVDQVVGTGDLAVAGKATTVHYTGWLENGTRLDSSVDRGQPFSFPLGTGRVIKG